MEERWIIVRGRQAELVAEAAAERLARQARAAEADRKAAGDSAALAATTSPAPVRARLVPVGVIAAADAKSIRRDCCEA